MSGAMRPKPEYLRALEDAATNLERHRDELISGVYPPRFLRDEETRSMLTAFADGIRNLHVESAQRVLEEYRAWKRGDRTQPVSTTADESSLCQGPGCTRRSGVYPFCSVDCSTAFSRLHVDTTSPGQKGG